MIASLRGEITQIEDTAVVIEVGGVGMRVFVPAPLRDKLNPGEVVLLNTHLVVREDALTLYGFESARTASSSCCCSAWTGSGRRWLSRCSPPSTWTPFNGRSSTIRPTSSAASPAWGKRPRRRSCSISRTA